MALPSTGAISLNNVNQELGKASPYNQVVSLNDANVRALFGIASGAIRMSDGYGKSTFTNSITFIDNVTTWTVPANVTSVRVKMWGAGGGGGYSGSGGGGAFGDFYLATTPGSQLDIYAGTYGESNVDDTDQCPSEVGPESCRNPNNHGAGGNGSGIRRRNAQQAVLHAFCVGGGGGGSIANGGAGGQNGDSDQPYSGGSAGGASSSNNGLPSGPTDPSYSQTFCGEGSICGVLTGRWGGGGGGGWSSGTGGAGDYIGQWGRGGGGGGGSSGYSDTQNYISSVVIQNGGAGAGYVPGGTLDQFYTNQVGHGGAAGASGNSGKIVILY